MKILLTAPPGLGKSTVIESVVNKFADDKYGIVAREILDEQGKRIGFTSINNALQSKQFMFLAKIPGTGSIGGEFDVDISAVDTFVVPEFEKGLQKPKGLIYVDEIGRAQAKSALFISVLRKIFQADCNLLASIVYDDESWAREFKQDKSACLIELTMSNRNHLPDILLSAFVSTPSFSLLDNAQKRTVYQLLSQLITLEQFVSAKKLFDNAIPYVINKKVQIKGKSDAATEYAVIGNTRQHKIIQKNDNGTFVCDCDLANGSGIYSNKSQICSHQLAVLLTTAKS